ncbi:MAG: glutaredoxin family protein [Actinomycetota bacterium]
MEIVLLTQVDCGFCEQAHRVLHDVAADYPIQVRTVDLGTPDGQVLAERGGVLFPPGVFIDGDAFSYGRLSERKLRRELDRRLRPRTAAG